VKLLRPVPGLLGKVISSDGVRNTLDAGFHLPARSRFGEGRQVRRMQSDFFAPFEVLLFYKFFLAK
jgi:hypothetical protein